MRKKGALRDIECGVVIGARWPALSISETAGMLGKLGFFSYTIISRYKRKCLKERKHPVSSSCVDKLVLLMSEIRGKLVN